MTKEQKTVFLDEMLLHSNDVLEMMCEVSSKHSTTTVSRDRDHIFDLIKKQVGFAELDRMGPQAIPYGDMGAIVCRRTLHGAAPTWTRPPHNIGHDEDHWQMVHRSHMYDQGMYCRSHMYDQGMPLLRECLEIKARIGDTDIKVMDTVHYLGELLYVQDQVIEAQALFGQVYEQMYRVSGPGHPLAMDAQSNIATCAVARGYYAAAEATFSEYFNEMLRRYGVGHRHTISSLLSLGKVRRLRGNFDLAKANLLHCIENYRHMDKLALVYESQYELGLVAYSTGEYNEATSKLSDSYSTYASHYGPTSTECGGVLLARFLVHIEMVPAFASLEIVDDFLSKFHTTGAFNSGWSNWKCLACFGLICGDMVMCLECSRLSYRLCQSCAQATPLLSLEQCAHSNNSSSWKAFTPPVRYLLEHRLTLLAQAEQWDEYAHTPTRTLHFATSFKSKTHNSLYV
ncbi:hypothetical protein DYB35_009336 [Aphanomyces astaci]|uniref:Uncharacterized protein n=1 Tax=Aphanomyces astaci TaxID=112090 RepID=A0A3R6WSM6_APHAT|nr:hypothetical protein DYB35_009336 [Aphanomyces astaci]